MNELSLFTGAGGGVLGSKLLGHRIIGYVEINEYCQKIIAQRIKDGILDEAPIFSNIQAFNRAGFAEQYKGLVDVVSGGFPCQDISCAGKGAGITGERSGLWFEMEQTIRVVRPRYIFIENSPVLIVRGLEVILCGLAEMGFDVAWGIISAADVGAPHFRKRIWILANANSKRLEKQRSSISIQKKHATFELCGPLMADADQPNGEAQRTSGMGTEKPERNQTPSSCGNWWSTEPNVGRVAHRVANRVDRLRAIGEGQVPIVAATAFRILSGII